MNQDTIFRKTGKGMLEVAERAHGLDKRLRRVLIMVDGNKPVAELSAFTRPGETEDTLLQLAEQGFIEPLGANEQSTDRVAYVPAANDPAVFALIKHHATAEISARLGSLGNLLIREIDGCADPLSLRLKLRNIENVLVHVLGREEGTQLARNIGGELTRLVPKPHD